MNYEEVYKEGFDAMLSLLVRKHGCCPSEHERNDTCPGYDVEPGEKGLSCYQCWSNYLDLK